MRIDISWQLREIVAGCEGSWFVFITPGVGAKHISGSCKAPRENFSLRVGWKRVLKPKCFKFRDVHDAEFILSVLEIVELIGSQSVLSLF